MHLQQWAFFLLQETTTVQWDPIHLWMQMGTLAKCVVILLFIMSAYSIQKLMKSKSWKLERSHLGLHVGMKVTIEKRAAKGLRCVRSVLAAA